jgi:flagellar hook protein FlgE
MMRAMYSAISGLKAHQVMLDVTANDLANVNTLGFKASRTTFADSLSQTQRSATSTSASNGGQNAAQIGLGVRLGSIDNQMGAGAFQATGKVTDLAIAGDGWFRVSPSIGGQIQYTRAGNFDRNAQGNLTTQDGLLVVGVNYDAATQAPGTTPTALNVPDSATNLAIGSDGLVSYDDTAGVRQYSGYVTLAKFPNEGGMLRASETRFTASPTSGNEVVGTPDQGGYGGVATGNVEMSNVDMASEFTQMITAQRGFQASSRVISASDQMLQDLVNLQH